MGTQLCSGRLLQQIIYCVGGVSVFFPLFTQSDLYEHTQSEKVGETLLTTITKERLTAEIIELIASVLDENLANQQQMLLLSGFSILGFLLQSVPPQQLNLETLSALKHLFNVVANSGTSHEIFTSFCTCLEMLVQISQRQFALLLCRLYVYYHRSEYHTDSWASFFILLLILKLVIIFALRVL
mgnify:CR=1 FL=1